jgi:glycosyltransferase involved in cell wall biosynthesis
MPTTRAVSIITYNRSNRLEEMLEGVTRTVPSGTDIFVVDDGSTDDQSMMMVELIQRRFSHAHYYRGPNKGVGVNKTRALYLMKNYHFSCLLEDDLVPQKKNWFETYEAASTLTDIHHFSRVQDKQVEETHPAFSKYLKEAMNVTPIYGASPRGDLTFITRKVITTVGGMNPAFEGVGYAHGEWSARVAKAGLISHPLHWIDLAEVADKFKQIGDTVGGRWDDDKDAIKKQIRQNRAVAKQRGKQDYVYCPLRIE